MTEIHKSGQGYNFEKTTIIPTGTSVVSTQHPTVVATTEVVKVTVKPYVYTPPKKHVIDNTNLSNHGIVLFRQSDLQSIFEKSGPNAKDNEFQVHYWALTLRMLAEDGSILDIAIPTCYFNYPQQVSAAHIDFEMSDVSDTSDKLLPLHEHVIQKLLSTNLIKQLTDRLGVKVELISQHLGSIHRHPGSSHSQAFSGTDYGKNPDSHGIVYPFQTAKLDASFAGIMAIDSGICKLAHNEYRVATGELGVDMTYAKGRCLAIVIDDLSKVSTVESILGKALPTHYIKTSNSIVSDNIEQLLVLWYKEVVKHLEPNTLAINPDYVTKRPAAIYSYDTYASYGIYSKENEIVVDTKEKETEPKDLLPFTKGITELNRMSKKEAIRWLAKICTELYGHCDIVVFKKLKHEEIINSILERQDELRKKRKVSSNFGTTNQIVHEENTNIVYAKKPSQFTTEYKRQALKDYINPSIINNATDARIDDLFEAYIP